MPGTRGRYLFIFFSIVSHLSSLLCSQFFVSFVFPYQSLEHFLYCTHESLSYRAGLHFQRVQRSPLGFFIHKY